MTKIIAIIGDGSSGKSTLIRHITGVARSGTVQLNTMSSELVTVYVKTQAPQEPPTKILPDDLVEILNQHAQADYAILPFRIRGVGISPAFDEYLDSFRMAAHEIIEPVIFLQTEDTQNISSYRLQSFLQEPSNVRSNNVKEVINFL